MNSADEILPELRGRLQELQGAYSEEYQRQAESLKFESGDQWDSTMKRNRRNRPMNIHNFTRTYVNRICNPYILNPVSGDVSGFGDNDKFINAELNNIEAESCASEAYQTAFRHETTCGRGFIHVGTKYKNNNSLDQDVEVRTILDPFGTYLGPHEKIDGSDAEYGVTVKYLDEDLAVKRHGVEVLISSWDLYQHWPKPSNTIPEVLYYRKKTIKRKRVFLIDGTYRDENQEVDFNERDVQTIRTIEDCVVEYFSIIGEQIVSQGVFDMPFIPIVPFLGERLYTDRGIEYGGVVDRVRDSQRQINYYSSSETEAVSLAPRSPWIMTAKQVQGFEKYWNTANTQPHDFIPYNPDYAGGSLVPPPQRLSSDVSTVGIIASKNQSIQDMARETAIFDPLLGESNGIESGIAKHITTNQGEIATAHLNDNLNKSLKQVTRCILYLMKNVYDTPRKVIVDDEEYRVTFSQVLENIEDMDIEISTGPMIESRKKESVSVLMDLMNLYPNSVPILAKRMAENLDIPNKEKVVEDLERIMPPEYKEPDDKQIPPEALQAMQTAQQTMQEMEQERDYLLGIISQYQVASIDDEKDRQNKIAIEQIKANKDLQIARLNAQVDLQTEIIKAQSSQNNEEMKQDGETERQLNSIVADAEKQNKEIASSVANEIIKIDNVQPQEGPFPPKAKGPVMDLGQNIAE